MNQIKKIAFDVNGTLDTYTFFLLNVIDSLIEKGHSVIVWSTDRELARQFVTDNFTPDQNIRFMEKVRKSQDKNPTVDFAIDDDSDSVRILNASKVFLIDEMPKDVEEFVSKLTN